MPFLWVGCAVAAMICIVFSIAYYTYRVAFYSPKNRKENIYDIPQEEQYEKGRAVMIAVIDEMAALPFEEVRITSFDGLTLFGRYYHIADGAPLEIQFHGWRGTAYRDFCGGHKLARKVGHNTLVVDQRAHGKSEGTTISFGIKERKDCLSWVSYAVERFGEKTPIYLVGVSMGAATVLMASGFALPDSVKGVIADSPFSSPAEIIKKVCKDMGFPPKLAFPFIYLGAKVFGGFSLLETTVAEEVKTAKIPALIIHGEADRFVPCAMSEEIFHAYGGQKRRVTFVGAGHGISYIEDPKKYERVVAEFLIELGGEVDNPLLQALREGRGE